MLNQFCNLKRFSKALFILFILNLQLFKVAQAKGDLDKVAILGKVDSINKNEFSFVKKVKENTVNGSKEIFLNGNELQIIKVQSKEQGIIKTVNWYFNNTQLIYCSQVWKGAESNNILDKQEFYLKNDKLIYWIKNKEEISDEKSEFRKMNDDLVAYSFKLVQESKR